MIDFIIDKQYFGGLKVVKHKTTIKVGFVPISIEDYVAKHLANNPEYEMLCNLTRYDQRNEEEFNCFAFIKK